MTGISKSSSSPSNTLAVEKPLYHSLSPWENYKMMLPSSHLLVFALQILGQRPRLSPAICLSMQSKQALDVHATVKLKMSNVVRCFVSFFQTNLKSKLPIFKCGRLEKKYMHDGDVASLYATTKFISK